VEKSLKDKVAVVTGASSGIGEATARELSGRGAMVVLAARDKERIEGVTREIASSGGRALALEADVSDEESVRQMVERAVEACGRIDVLVNNAGMGLSGNVEELRGEDLRRVLEVNFVGALSCIQAALPHMPRGGSIVNVSSVIGKRSISRVGGYCASKSALNALSDALRVEVAGQGITVTSVYPGTTRTEFSERSLRTRGERKGWRPKGVSSERVAGKICRAIERGKRDVYVSSKDRAFVAASTLFPAAFDRLLGLVLMRG
jgi:short-subunit dehydrogenase